MFLICLIFFEVDDDDDDDDGDDDDDDDDDATWFAQRLIGSTSKKNVFQRGISSSFFRHSPRRLLCSFDVLHMARGGGLMCKSKRK